MLKQTVNEEKHDKGPLHFAIQLDDSVIEFYPQKPGKPNTPMTFGLSADIDTFEYLQTTAEYKNLNKNSLIISGPENNQIIVHKMDV